MPDDASALRRPSIYDVARRADVSHMTVSRVLNGHPNIRVSTRERVEQAIADLGYRPSSIARALATRRAMRIGVLVDGPVEYGPNSTLRALERAARDAGYGVSAISIDGAHIGDGVVELATQGVDALCVVAPRSSSLDVLRGHPSGIPTVVFAADPDPELVTVTVDQRAGGRAAVEHLVALGHRSVLHLAGPLDWLDARAREQSWREVLGDAARHLVVGDWTSDFGYRIGRESPLIDDVTAVFAANDQMALGLVHGLIDRGLRVPEDVSVVGFDDVPDARHFLPPLTTVRQDFAALGAAGLAAILHVLDGDDPPVLELVAPELVVRASTAPPRA